MRAAKRNAVGWTAVFALSLGGLASASLTLSAALQITLKPLPVPNEADLAGQGAVGIHISICWVINIDFDGSWGFSTTISL